MADNSPPPQVRHQMSGGGGGLKIVHPHLLRMQQAHTVEMGGGGGGGGGGGANASGAKGARAGSGVRAGFGGDAEPRAARAENGDAAVTGNYERMPYTTLYGFPIAGGGLTEKGQADKNAHDQFSAFATRYSSSLDQGLSRPDALRAAARGLPDGVGGLGRMLFEHPDAARMLTSADALHNALSGAAQQAQYTQVKGADGKYYQVARDPATGQVVGQPTDIGMPGTPAKTPVGKEVQRTSVGPDGTSTITHGTVANGIFTPGTTGAGQPDTETRPPTLGEVKAQQAIAAGKTTPTLTPYSGDPVPTATSTKHPLTQGETSYLANAGNFISDLKVARDYANAAGPISGAVSYVGGKYIGVNPDGAMYAAALNRLDQGVYAEYGIKGSAGAKQLMATLPTHSEAPSYVKATLTAQISNATKELQSNADLAEQRMGMPLPGTLKAQIAKQADVYPLSDQHAASASWVARNYPDKLTGQQAVELSHRTDLEPDAVTGLNSALDTQAARRQQDQQAASQRAAAQQQTSAQRASDRAAQDQVDSGASAQPQGQGQGQSGLVSGLPAPAGGATPQSQDQSGAGQGAGTGSQPQQGGVGPQSAVPAAPQGGDQDFSSSDGSQGQGASAAQPAPTMAAMVAPGAAAAPQPTPPPAPPPVTANATTGTLATPSEADDIAQSIAAGTAGGF